MEPTHEQDARATSNSLPLILGHRGSSAVAPENTLAAFKRSITDGADGFEFDVRLARDGKPVVIHDATLQRTANYSALVSALTSDELATIDVGSWFNLLFPEKALDEYRRQTVPTLAQVFALIAGTNQLLDIEMKCEKNESSRLAAAVVHLIKEYSLTKLAVVSSFDLSAIAEVKQIASDIRTAALFGPRLKHPASLLRKIKVIDLALEVKADELALHHTLVSKRIVEKARSAGLPVVVWTVDNVRWIKRAQDLGIAALITNNPVAFVAERLRYWIRAPEQRR